ncbi:molybdopterin-guanine dinucleotide biosynthesis protein B [Roseisolibacter sp. H3M3-2]|uniref:molybdopterin-guanine dinucleotide biosynthesis protein B n=1 Tax=Roseisolibacter sp. H3M3-2 TaxID=3031323 RepID=UPI0023DB339D|nr:molybdopterin-guanine dinucleotide biosynthesis protein B [Roseisolibacter sp. H3M3-2]MDF1503857.1 molybdopterin-guanine dinucleotide biosynthesis protein B [Roseisolibacter sp. H3M3-2]
MTTPPMLAIVGRKHSGKTTLLVRLAAELTRRGRRVMTIKHGHHTFDIDPSTTDTYRHYHEGLAERVVMAAPDKLALVMRWDEELPPEAIAERYLRDADVVLCEGFKRAALPRVEVFREAAHDAPLYEPGTPEAARWLAVLTDRAAPLPGVRTLHLADPGWLDALAAIVEREVLAPRGGAGGSAAR